MTPPMRRAMAAPSVPLRTCSVRRLTSSALHGVLLILDELIDELDYQHQLALSTADCARVHEAASIPRPHQHGASWA